MADPELILSPAWHMENENDELLTYGPAYGLLEDVRLIVDQAAILLTQEIDVVGAGRIIIDVARLADQEGMLMVANGLCDGEGVVCPDWT